ncbi:MAG TPA: DUF5667 domain-containing protein, partial [Jatrophihabitans sp.]|nr:DUF5667 domain-containing protein [Jatrophihabitans sp.]
MGSARFSVRPDRKHHGRGRSATEQDLIARLRQLPTGPEPDAGFTGELRAQLVAITPRLVTESTVATDSTPEAASRRTARRAGFLGRIRRPLIAVVSATAVLAVLLGLAVWVSHSALPGQSLYGIKRASENFSLSLAGTDAGKGKAYLQQATSRATETTKLVGDPAGPAALSGQLTKLLGSTLQSADSDTRNGMRLLARAALDQHSGAPLAGLSDWVNAQSARFTALQNRLPAGPARARTQLSLVLLQRVSTRLGQWSSELNCGCLSPKLVDDIGPMPCSGCRTQPKPTPSLSGLPNLPTGHPSASSSLLPSLPGLGGNAT